MLFFKGYGFFIFMAVQIACLIIALKMMPSNASDLVQMIYIGASLLISGMLQYPLGRYLNKNGEAHTINGMRLEHAGLVMNGGIIIICILGFLFVD